MSVLGAVIGFFSPSDYVLPKKHLQTTINHLLAAGVHVAVVQVVRPGKKPEPLPPGVVGGVWYSAHTLFYKENLWNLGAQLLANKYLLFIDADILISPDDWADRVVAQLDQFDLIQPFELALWQSRDGDKIELRRRAIAIALSRGTEPHLNIYHPGFSWAMRRDAFDKIGGWYDLTPSGTGDTATVFAIAKQEYGELWTQKMGAEACWWRQKSFQAYRQRVLSANLRVGYCAGVTATHLWHGDRKNRLYMGRHSFLPRLTADGEFPLIRRKDGLLEWADDSHNFQLQRYFDYRKEDG